MNCINGHNFACLRCFIGSERTRTESTPRSSPQYSLGLLYSVRLYTHLLYSHVFVTLITITIFLFVSCYGRDIVRLSNEYDKLTKEFENFKKESSEKLAAIEKDVKGAFRSKADFSSDLDSFKIEIGDIKGRIDEIATSLSEISLKEIETDKNNLFEISKLSVAIKSIEERIGKIEKSASDFERETVSSSGKLYELEKSVNKLGDSFTEKKNGYEIGLDLFNSGKYEKAIDSFMEYIKENKKDRDCAKAQFWIGESYFKLKDYERAILEYQKVIEKYKNSDKKCSATLKQGISFYKLGKPKEAKIFLESVISECEKEQNLIKEAKKELKNIE